MLKVFGKIKEDFGMIATLLGFIIDSVAIIALVSQGVPPALPVLGTSAQLLIWTLALISYLGFLRDFWRKATKQDRDESYAYKFEYFLFSDLPRLKNPYALLGFVFLLFMLFWIIGGMLDTAKVFAIIILLFVLTTLSIVIEIMKTKYDDQIQTWEEWETIDNEETTKLWYPRIAKQFKKAGYAVDYDLASLYSTSPSFVYKVMRKFVDQYGATYDFYFVTDKVSKRVPSSIKPDEMETQYRYPSILTRHDLLDARPWLRNRERFFDSD